MDPDVDWQPVTRFFGPPAMRRPGEVQTPVPIDRLCILCEERVIEGDTGTINSYDQVTHYECMIRSVVGSVGHQQQRCSCYGGTDEDPPGLTRREAAIAATRLFHQT